MYLLHLYGYKSKKKNIYFLFIFFLIVIQTIQTEENEILYSLFFSPSLPLSKHTQDN